MNQREIQKAVEKAIKEEQRKQEWKRSLDHNVQEIRKAEKGAQKALLGAFTTPVTILGTAIAQDDRKRKRQRATTKKKHSIVGTIMKFLLFLFAWSIVMGIFRSVIG